MTQHALEPNAIIGDRYRIVSQMSSGFAADVFRVVDSQGKAFVLKLQRKDAIFPQYIEHLRALDAALSRLQIDHVMRPIATGLHDDRYWEAFTFLEDSESLRNLLFSKKLLSPRVSLDLLSKISLALNQLHSNGIIHGDIKPSNILVEQITGIPTLIDFGMVEPLGESKEDLIVVGTYSYLPPAFRRGMSSAHGGPVSLRISVQAPVGPYIDVYALGILSLEMLTGRAEAPDPLSIDHVAATLLGGSPALRSCQPAVMGSLATLVRRMLIAEPSQYGLSASEISTTAASLRNTFPEVEDEIVSTSGTVSSQVTRESVTEVKVVSGVANALRDVARSLADRTAAFIVTEDKVIAAEPIQTGSQQLATVTNAFAEATERIKTSWRFGMGMTWCAFALLIIMILCAVAFGIWTRKPEWSLTFGGMGGATVLGTLLWKPYDRIFRATILAQRIQLIQFQVETTFQSTTDLNKRLDICREAIKALGETLSLEATPKTGTIKKPSKKAKAQQ